LKRGKILKQDYYFTDGLLSFELTEWAQRRIAPYAILTHAFTIIVFFCLIFTQANDFVGIGQIDFLDGAYVPIETPEGEGLYSFNVRQNFPPHAPVYSELEIEVLDEHKAHLYSVYKDLWQEDHPNGEGGISQYRDVVMDFKVAVPENRRLYVRAFTNLKTPIDVTVRKQRSGSLYFWYAFFASGAFSVIFIVGYRNWGTPFEMIKRVKKSKSIWKNKGFIRFSIVLLGGVIFLLVLSFRYTGYAQGGDRTQTPSFFFSNEEVIYLG